MSRTPQNIRLLSGESVSVSSVVLLSLTCRGGGNTKLVTHVSPISCRRSVCRIYEEWKERCYVAPQLNMVDKVGSWAIHVDSVNGDSL